MKIILLLLSVLMLFIGCKKDKTSAREFYLSKSFRNGLLQKEFVYSSDKKPLRKNNYSTNLGQSTFSGFRLYQYGGNGLLNEVMDFNDNSQLSSKYTLEYDVNGSLTRLDDRAADDDHVQYYYLFSYNAEGKMSKYALYNANGNKKNIEATLSYDAAGNPVKMIRMSFLNPAPTLYDSTTYSFDKKLPSHWNYYEIIPVIGLSIGEDLFTNMICTGSYRYYVDAPPAKTDKALSNKIYNGDGYLIKQNITTKGEYIGPATITNEEMTYEYVEL